MQRFDAIIIGAGQAGPALAGRLTAAGQSVVYVERNLFGGTCVNTGCMPTKTLVASARAAHVARRAADFGVVVQGPVSVDMKKVRARAAKVSETSRTGVEGWIRGMPKMTVFHGHARFESAKSVKVDLGNGGSELLESDRIFIDVGGRARVPDDMRGVRDVPFLTNTSIIELDTLPRHLVVVGGSYIGLEFAQMYRRFGAEVTVVEMGPRLISREDPEISDAIKTILENEGVNVRLDAKCIELGRTSGSDDVEVRLDCAHPEKTVRGSHLLLAVGREPNTHDLGLEKAGVAVDRHGYITVSDTLETNVKGIYALGDCNGRGAFTHTSYNDFEIAAANLLDDDHRRLSDRIVAYALYVDPPLGRCGLTETEARKLGRPVLVAHRPMKRVGRAVERDETQGFMKVVVDKETKKILGAAILGIEGDEAIHGILDTMYADVPYTTLMRSVPIHPTVSELIPTMLGDLAES